MENLERALLGLMRGASPADCIPVAEALGLPDGGECLEDGACERCCAQAAEALESRARAVVRCRECAHCKEFPQGSVCTVRGSAGWFAVGADDYCSRAVRREADPRPAPSECPVCGEEGGRVAVSSWPNRGRPTVSGEASCPRCGVRVRVETPASAGGAAREDHDRAQDAAVAKWNGLARKGGAVGDREKVER